MLFIILHVFSFSETIIYQKRGLSERIHFYSLLTKTIGSSLDSCIIVIKDNPNILPERLLLM